MKSAPTIAFDYRPSRGIGLAVALVCVGAMVAIGLSALPPIARVALALATMAFGACALHRHWTPRFHRIAWRTSGWVLIDAANDEHAVILAAHARLGSLLTLDFRDGAGACFRPVLAPDNLDPDTRRRLILLLARADVVHAG